MRSEPGEEERSYVIQELIDHVVNFTFYFKSKWGRGILVFRVLSKVRIKSIFHFSRIVLDAQ